MKRIFDTDPDSGAVEYFYYDDLKDTVTIERRCDVEPIIERNKRSYNESPKSGERKIAEIPVDILLKWKQDYGIDWNNRNHWPKIKRLLDDPEWLYLRTAPGCIGDRKAWL